MVLHALKGGCWCRTTPRSNGKGGKTCQLRHAVDARQEGHQLEGDNSQEQDDGVWEAEQRRPEKGLLSGVSPSLRPPRHLPQHGPPHQQAPTALEKPTEPRELLWRGSSYEICSCLFHYLKTKRQVVVVRYFLRFEKKKLSLVSSASQNG